MDRRDFLRLAAGAATLAAGSGCRGKSSGSTSDTVAGAERRLRILQWNHFVPAYDQWFDGFAARWGEEHDTDVVVDRVTAEDVRLRASAEVSSRQGHDLLAFTGTIVGALEDDVIDHRDIVAEIESKVGPMLPAIARGVHNPKTGKYIGVSDGWAPQFVNYRTDLWPSEGGRFPDTWEAILRVAPALKAAGTPVGIGMSSSIDAQTTALALIFAFGGSLQDEAGVLTLNSPATVEAVKFGISLYRSGMFEDVLTWDNFADNRFLASGKASLIIDPVSSIRAAEKQDPELAADPAARPTGKYGLFAEAGEWTANPGRPGFDNAAVSEVTNEYMIAQMFAAAAGGELSAEEAVKRAHAQAQPIFDKWRERGKI